LLSLNVHSQKRINYTAATLEFAKSIAPDAWRLLGNVVFVDRDARMYCDSAYFYQNTEDIDAFGNVRIIPDSKGNTSLTGKILHYKSADRIANITGDVVLIDDSAVLKTATVFYNMNTGMANYPGKGTIVQGKTVIVSDLGAYNKNLKEAYFKRNVVVTNPEGIIHTDTMNYNTVSKNVYFLGPTIINSPEKDTIYCEKGWYNMDNEISSYRQNAWIKGGSNIIKGDTLYYEKFTGLGKAYGHIEMRDSSQNYLLKGNYAQYNRFKNTGLVTKKAVMIQVDNKDSLYLHGDTIYYGWFTVKKDIPAAAPDSLKATPDTLSTALDTLKAASDTFKYVKAYHHVKFFRNDLQGKCDSMYYSFQDSTLQFIGSPVLWAQGNQLTAEHMKIFIKNKAMERLELTSSALIVSQEDTGKYNQIKGRDMTGYFVNNNLHKMYVKGNGQMIYFHTDRGLVVGIQKTESSDIRFFFKKNKKDKLDLDRISYINSVQGSYHPPLELKGNDLFLKDFIWLEKYRPRTWPEIFIW
jgi:lipopolysaccharide export system protein LptA